MGGKPPAGADAAPASAARRLASRDDVAKTDRAGEVRGMAAAPAAAAVAAEDDNECCRAADNDERGAVREEREEEKEETACS